MLPAEDALDLEECVLDDCSVNLTAVQIPALPRPSTGAGLADGRGATIVARQALAEYVADYQRRGNEALAVYPRPRVAPSQLREASARLLRQSTELQRVAPAIASYLDRYPAVLLPAGAEEFFYWSVMSFGMKLITRANHVVLMPLTTDGLAGFIAASRTIYASHYFRDGLEVKHIIPVSPERAAFYLPQRQPLAQRIASRLKGLLLGGRIRSLRAAGSSATCCTSRVRQSARLHETRRGRGAMARRAGHVGVGVRGHRYRGGTGPSDVRACMPEACAACHGADGRGAAPVRTGLAVPLPDFTDCGYADAVDPDADGSPIAHERRSGPRALIADAGVRRGAGGREWRLLDHVRALRRRPMAARRAEPAARFLPRRRIPRMRRSSASGVDPRRRDRSSS